MEEELRARLGEINYLYMFLAEDFRQQHGRRFEGGSEQITLLANVKETAQDPVRLAMRSEFEAVLESSSLSSPPTSGSWWSCCGTKLEGFWPRKLAGKEQGLPGRSDGWGAAPGIWEKVKTRFQQRTGEEKSIDAIKKLWQRASGTLMTELETRGFSPAGPSSQAA